MFTGFVCSWYGCLLIGNVIMISVAVGSKSEMSVVNRSLCFHRPQKEARTSAQLSSCDLKCPIILIQAFTRTHTIYKLHINLQYWVSVKHLKTHLHFLSTVTNKKPSHVSITKVKQFQGSSAFIKRSQWTVDQLRQVNGIDPNKVCYFYSASTTATFWSIFRFILSDYSYSSLSSAVILSKDSPEFDLTFENAFDQWVAGSAGEKCTFIQILHHTCQRYSSARKPEFINCQSKLLGGKTANEQTLLTVLHQYFYLEQSDSEMPELLLSHCAVSQFESHYV